LLASDFNETTSLDEPDHGGPAMQRRCSKFQCYIEDNGLIAIGFFGSKFTSIKGDNVETMKRARLDRALNNLASRANFQEGAVRHLIHNHSDHCPLLIDTSGFAIIPKTPKPFRYQVAWETHSRFQTFHQERWNSRAPFLTALHNLASDLQQWNKHVFSILF